MRCAACHSKRTFGVSSIRSKKTPRKAGVSLRPTVAMGISALPLAAVGFVATLSLEWCWAGLMFMSFKPTAAGVFFFRDDVMVRPGPRPRRRGGPGRDPAVTVTVTVTQVTVTQVTVTQPRGTVAAPGRRATPSHALAFKLTVTVTKTLHSGVKVRSKPELARGSRPAHSRNGVTY